MVIIFSVAVMSLGLVACTPQEEETEEETVEEIEIDEVALEDIVIEYFDLLMIGDVEGSLDYLSANRVEEINETYEALAESDITSEDIDAIVADVFTDSTYIVYDVNVEDTDAPEAYVEITLVESTDKIINYAIEYTDEMDTIVDVIYAVTDDTIEGVVAAANEGDEADIDEAIIITFVEEDGVWLIDTMEVQQEDTEE
jgi:hypothetical protein